MRRTLPGGEDQRAAGRPGPPPRLLDLIPRAADDEDACAGMRAAEHGRRVEQQIEPLVSLEGAGVQHHRLVGAQAVARPQLGRRERTAAFDVAAHHVLDQERAVSRPEGDGGVLQFPA